MTNEHNLFEIGADDRLVDALANRSHVDAGGDAFFADLTAWAAHVDAVTDTAAAHSSAAADDSDVLVAHTPATRSARHAGRSGGAYGRGHKRTLTATTAAAASGIALSLAGVAAAITGHSIFPDPFTALTNEVGARSTDVPAARPTDTPKLGGPTSSTPQFQAEGEPTEDRQTPDKINTWMPSVADGSTGEQALTGGKAVQGNTSAPAGNSVPGANSGANSAASQGAPGSATRGGSPVALIAPSLGDVMTQPSAISATKARAAANRTVPQSIAAPHSYTSAIERVVTQRSSQHTADSTVPFDRAAESTQVAVEQPGTSTAGKTSKATNSTKKARSTKHAAVTQAKTQPTRPAQRVQDRSVAEETTPVTRPQEAPRIRRNFFMPQPLISSGPLESVVLNEQVEAPVSAAEPTIAATPVAPEATSTSEPSITSGADTDSATTDAATPATSATSSDTTASDTTGATPVSAASTSKASGQKGKSASAKGKVKSETAKANSKAKKSTKAATR